MAHVLAYHRPDRLPDALALLGRDGVRSALLAGGTWLNATRPDPPVEVVDLQALDLDGVEIGGTTARLGAMVRLDTVADDERLPAVLRDLARRELPSTLRTLATVGGTVVAGGWESELLAGLLAYGAVVHVAGPDGASALPLAAVLADPQAVSKHVITAVEVCTDGRAAAARTGRTPGDTPIVAAVARRDGAGTVRVAMSGVAATPVVVDDPGGLRPPGDFRGSAEYRRELARVLNARARAEVER